MHRWRSPSPASPGQRRHRNKPVGTVCFAWAIRRDPAQPAWVRTETGVLTAIAPRAYAEHRHRAGVADRSAEAAAGRLADYSVSRLAGVEFWIACTGPLELPRPASALTRAARKSTGRCGVRDWNGTMSDLFEGSALERRRVNGVEICFRQAAAERRCCAARLPADARDLASRGAATRAAPPHRDAGPARLWRLRQAAERCRSRALQQARNGTRHDGADARPRHERYFVCGHDRGGRVSHRLALDHRAT